MNPLDLTGWIGSIFLLLFYWLLGSQRIGWAYFCSTVGAALWLAVGVAITFFESTPESLPSLIFVEAAIIFMNIRGILLWRKKKIVDRN